MKELSIEEKAKRYNVTIEKLRTFYRDYDTVSRLIDVKEELANLFPELKSEDERIRKWIVDELNNSLHEIEALYSRDYDNRDKDDIIREDYLRKALSLLEKMGETFTKKDIDDAYLKGICDAKHELEKQGEQKPVTEGTFVNVDEVREDFIQEVYRVLDADPTNDRANQIIDAFDLLPTILIQKPAWSEEDEGELSNILDFLNSPSTAELCPTQRNNAIAWLKSLKDRYTWKPSDGQMKALKEACDEHWEPDGLDQLYTLYQDLKKLREE